jgi:hypothetical protein
VRWDSSQTVAVVGGALRRMILVLTVAGLTAAMMLAMAKPAFADQGGVFNQHACHGQSVSDLASNLGGTPAELARNDPRFDNAGDVNKFIKGPLCSS